MDFFSANGKLLISGEYAVLDGALALAVPCRFGQTLEVDFLTSTFPALKWSALLSDSSLWFTAEYGLKDLNLIQSSDEKSALKLKEILEAVEKIKPGCLSALNQSVHCTTQLEFPKDWGLGSSSTLIWLLAQFTGADAFALNKLSFKTSGYDVAAASSDTPFFYQLKENQRLIEPIAFNPVFKDRLFFVHLNQKQDTQISVSANYKNLKTDKDWLNGISALTYNMQKTNSLEEFGKLMELHEEMIASRIGLKKVKELYFSDYDGAIKSLGAWGGDFVMITAVDGFETYFKSKGYATILSFDALILH